MTLLYAAGAITKKEINTIEANLIREQFGMKRDSSD
jgi:hypothetical protein